jgi:ParB/RepB/Spo0J family partition protein
MTARPKTKAAPVSAGGMWDPLPVSDPAAPESAPALPAERLERIPIDQVHESPLNPRRHYDQGSLEQLMDSLLQTGQLTPVVVRPRREGGYELGAGHRRRRAVLLACERHPEGAAYRHLGELLAIVRDLDDRALIETLNVENLQRDDLHPLEEAEGFRTLMERAGYDVAKIAARIGRSTRYVYDSLTLLKLVPAAKKLFLAGAFERGHAIELARLAPTDQQRALDSDRAGAFHLGGLFVPELVDEGGLDFGTEDAPRKPVTVREFKHWVDDQVRFKPAAADPVLFPETVQAVATAAAAKEKVIEITYDHVIPDAARLDGAPRVYGAQAWRSATKGIPSPDHQGKDGKSCDYAITGVVVIGERRGEAFKVCIAKEKCTVHWADWQKERRQRQSGTVPATRSTGGGADDSYARQRAKEEAERQRYGKAAKRIQAAIEQRIAALEVTPTGPIVQRVVRAVAGYGRKLVIGKTLEDLVRGMARELVRRDLKHTWSAAQEWPKLGKAFGVDVGKIVDEVSPPEKPTAKGRPVKKAAKGTQA